jgi:hypothetical protein
MTDSHTEQHAYTLRAIAEYLRLEPLKRIARQPGVRSVYRVTIYHHDRRALDSVATLCRERENQATLSLNYEGVFHLKPLIHNIPPERYEAFTLALQKLHFDHLADQPGMPLYGLDFWMIERAAGTFVKSIIVAPQTANGVYAELVAIIKTHLPEALREIARLP